MKLGHGLHLIQTSYEPIGLIAEKCGYSSSSRFTDRFKQLYGLTPSALRKTRMSDSGE
ncbi:helix-turn-helix domain-containing protein [Pseudoalteromonas piscicida]